jgi:hypothetical protein
MWDTGKANEGLKMGKKRLLNAILIGLIEELSRARTMKFDDITIGISNKNERRTIF